MTGYGRGVARLGQSELVVEARSVNHRFLDTRIQLGGSLSSHAPVVEALVRARLQRGRVEVTGKLCGAATGGAQLDRARAKQAHEALTALARDLHIQEPVPLSLLANVPNLWVEQSAVPEDLESVIEAATLIALQELTTMRDSEGAALARDLTARVQTLRTLTAAIQPHMGRLVAESRDRMRARLETLLAGRETQLEEARLEQEIALLADRSDVTEELTRLESHCDQFETLAQASGPVGRKLDFLLQEMAREVNTTGSKVADTDVTRLVVDLKAELERMREQTQNVL